MTTIKKIWPLIVTVVMAIAPVLSPGVQEFYKGHPAVAGALWTVWATFKWLLPSPVAPAPPAS